VPASAKEKNGFVVGLRRKVFKLDDRLPAGRQGSKPLELYPIFLWHSKTLKNSFMTVLHIEHPVPNYEGWKKAFDSDPMNRKKAGVKKYRVYRSVQEPHHVAIDLEFDDYSSAEKMLAALEVMWQKVEGSVITGPKAKLFEVIETIEL